MADMESAQSRVTRDEKFDISVGSDNLNKQIKNCVLYQVHEPQCS